jgi:hypothetical protein
MIARNPVYFQRDVVCQWIERSIGQSNQGGCFLYLHYSLSSSSQPGSCTMRRDACARRRARLAFHPLFVPGEKTWQNSIAGAAPAGGVRRRTSILPKLNYHTSSEQPAPLMRIAKVLTFFCCVVAFRYHHLRAGAVHRRRSIHRISCWKMESWIHGKCTYGWLLHQRKMQRAWTGCIFLQRFSHPGTWRTPGIGELSRSDVMIRRAPRRMRD